MEASRPHIITVALVILGFLFSFVIGFFAKEWFSSAASFKELHSGGFSFVSPLLECESTENTKELSSFEHRIQEVIDEAVHANQITEASVYFRDLNNGPWFGINEKTLFTPASLLKVPYMISLFKEAESDKNLLSRLVPYVPDTDTGTVPNFVPEKKLEPGKYYTVEQLVEQMIVYSENGAKDMLLKAQPGLSDSLYLSLGIVIPGTRGIENFMSVKEYASFFRILYNASYLDLYYSNKALELLSRTDFRDGLVAGVPKGVIVAHKFGERGLGDIKQLHDCGVIYERTRPYLLCVMTRGGDFKELAKTIQTVSRETYSAVTSQ